MTVSAAAKKRLQTEAAGTASFMTDFFSNLLEAGLRLPPRNQSICDIYPNIERFALPCQQEI